jgi:Holliday junction DNA helicase RuvA
VAVAILSAGPPRELLRAIATGDSKRFQAVPGVGKRTAERLIVELREKIADEITEGIPAVADGEGSDPRRLARDGLVGLGYTIAEAESLLAEVAGDTPEELIAAALRRGAKEAA